jgi:L-glyceraldehyde 3-phosphate reductase
MSDSSALLPSERMPYRRCGRSGLLLPALSLGLYQNFGDDARPETCAAIVRRAFDLGITHFDLANNYGVPAGSAEALFGRLLPTVLPGRRDELVVSTKAGYDMWTGPYGEWGSRKHLLASLDQSLRRLGLDYVDLFYSHRFDPDTPLEETMGALASAVHQGKALYVGVSNYEPAVAAEAFRLLRGMGVPCLANQVSYSLFNRRLEAGGLALHARQGVGTVVFQPLQRGLLSASYLGELDERRRARVQAWGVPEAWLARLPALAKLARERGQSLAQMAIAWTLRDPSVSSALVGASSVQQLEDSLGSLRNLRFDDGTLSAIERILA